MIPGEPDCGYLRIFTFNVDDPTGFVDEVSRVVAHLPCHGLILDVRGNGGGRSQRPSGSCSCSPIARSSLSRCGSATRG